MADHAWKQFERRMSRDMGTERIPVTGERHGSDGRTEMFCFQFKNRKILPAFLNEWLGGICTVARFSNKIGVLVVKTPGLEDRDAIVMLRWSDWVDLHGPEKFDAITHRRARKDQQKANRKRQR